MQPTRARRLSVSLTVALAGLALAACGSATQSRQPMMGGGSTVPENQPGPGMMGGASGYHYSRLTCAPPAGLPGSRINVGLADMGMTQMMGGDAPLGARMMLRPVPDTVTPGQVSFVAANLGWRTHELVILPLPQGQSSGQRVPGADGKIDEAGSLGEASVSCGSGAGDGIQAGAVGWVTVTLKPGRYELVCNLTNHYANGMHHELLVNSRR